MFLVLVKMLLGWLFVSFVTCLCLCGYSKYIKKEPMELVDSAGPLVCIALCILMLPLEIVYLVIMCVRG